MQMCLYEGKPVYAFEILGKNNIIEFDIEKEFRAASSKSLLKCSECGNPVIFKFKNLDKMRPHFAHLNIGSNQNCSYGKETEEHIEGKRIILDIMRYLYPDIYHQIRYKIKSINRYADLYFRLDNQELIIEFQRTDLDLESFEDKIKSYDSISIKNLWVLSGSKEDLVDITREYNLTFFQRLNLNIENKPVLFLDVVSREITMMSKIIFEDEESSQILSDKLFYKTYSVDNLIIKMDGSINSDFQESYESERLLFIKEYQEKLDSEKNSFNGKKYFADNIEKYKKQSKSEISIDKIAIHYKIYENLINKLLKNDDEELFIVISMACYNNTTVYEVVKEILEEKIDNGDKKSKMNLIKIDEILKQ